MAAAIISTERRQDLLWNVVAYAAPILDDMRSRFLHPISQNPVGDERRPSASSDLDRHVMSDTHKSWRRIGNALDRNVRAQFAVYWNRREEAHAIKAIVDAHPRIREGGHGGSKQPRQQGQAEQPMRDRPTKARSGCPARIGMDERIVPCVQCEAVYPRLIDEHPCRGLRRPTNHRPKCFERFDGPRGCCLR